MIKEIKDNENYWLCKYRYNDGVLEQRATGGIWQPCSLMEDAIKRDIAAGRMAVIEPEQPKAEPRYFVNETGFLDNVDHARFEGRKAFAVKEDGTEIEAWWTIEDAERWIKHGGWKEVFPISSDSLRRSHKYAAMYSKGKEAGYRDGLAAGKKEATAEADKAYAQGRQAGITEGRAQVDTSKAYADGKAAGIKEAVEKLKANLSKAIAKDVDEAVGNGSLYGRKLTGELIASRY